MTEYTGRHRKERHLPLRRVIAGVTCLVLSAAVFGTVLVMTFYPLHVWERTAVLVTVGLALREVIRWWQLFWKL